jgi:hypothetical protein
MPDRDVLVGVHLALSVERVLEVRLVVLDSHCERLGADTLLPALGLSLGCEHLGERSAASRARRSMKSRWQTERLREVARALTGRDETEEPPSRNASLNPSNV